MAKLIFFIGFLILLVIFQLDTSYPVKIYREGVHSLSEAKRSYAKSFDHPLEVVSAKSSKLARSCKELIELIENGWDLDHSVADQVSINDFIAYNTKCEILKDLLQLKDSKLSYIGNIEFDKDFIQYLPSSIHSRFAMNSDYDKIFERAEQTKTSFLSLNRALEEDSIKFVTEDRRRVPNSIHYEDLFYIDLQAIGDANNDGIEDIIIRVVEDSKGSMQQIQRFILTRLSESSPILEESEKARLPKKGCSGDEIDRIRSEFSRKYKPPFNAEALSFLETGIAQCKEFSPQIHLLWLVNDAAFVGFKLHQPDICKKYLSLAREITKEIGFILVPHRLRKALLHNKEICEYSDSFF